MDGEALEVMSTLAVFGPLRERIGPAFERASGTRLSLAFDPTAVLLAAVAAGRRADVAIATGAGVAGLVAQGVLSAEVVPIARSRVGLARRVDGPEVDISTPEALRAVLLAAKSVAFSASGASGQFFAGLIERMGIAPQIRAKAVVVEKGFTAERLVSGEAELAVQQVSELMAVPGVAIVGPFPEPCQVATEFVAAVFAGSIRPAQARAFVAALVAPDAVAAFAAAGLEAIAR